MKLIFLFSILVVSVSCATKSTKTSWNDTDNSEKLTQNKQQQFDWDKFRPNSR